MYWTATPLHRDGTPQVPPNGVRTAPPHHHPIRSLNLEPGVCEAVCRLTIAGEEKQA
jgi:hypothetical protein